MTMRGDPHAGRSWWRYTVIVAPLVWLVLFFAVPFLILLKIALAEAALQMPPYTPLIAWTDGVPSLQPSLRNFALLLGDSLYLQAWLNSLRLALLTTLACLSIGLPMALGIARAPRAWRGLLLLAVMLPFWTSFLLRVYAWIGLLGSDGPVNALLLGLGLVQAPLQILYTESALLIGMVYAYLPFMILPLYANLERHDPALLEAAADLGARPLAAFTRVTLPAAVPGILAGSTLVFVPAAGEFVIPSLLGGPDALMIGRVLWDEFFGNRDWPVAAAVAIVLTVVLVLPMLVLQARGFGRSDR
jgi:putrescine transport system permease protein